MERYAVIREESPYEFKYYEQAKDTIKYLTDSELEKVWETLYDTSENKMLESTEINEFFWFETDTIAEWLGYESFDKIMERGIVERKL